MKAEEHPLSQKPLIERITPGPWSWTIDDYSNATLHGKDEMEDHVMCSSPCKSCQEHAKKEVPAAVWKWGRCTTPKEADAELIAMAPELLGKISELEETIARISKERDEYQSICQDLNSDIISKDLTIASLNLELKSALSTLLNTSK